LHQLNELIFPIVPEHAGTGTGAIDIHYPILHSLYVGDIPHTSPLRDEKEHDMQTVSWKKDICSKK